MTERVSLQFHHYFYHEASLRDFHLPSIGVGATLAKRGLGPQDAAINIDPMG